MFIDIDYKKRIQKTKIHLARPNKKIFSHIDEYFNGTLSIKLGNINELEFSILHYVEDDESKELIRNKHVDLIKERMLLRVTMIGYEEWFIVDSIEENGDETDVFDVKAFSLGYETKGKMISGLQEEGINATDLFTELLKPTLWKIGYIDPMFDEMYRSFESGDDSNSLECIISASETYGGLLKWDTKNRELSMIDISKDGKFRGMSVDYGKFLRSITRSRTTDEMVTRLYVEGNEGLSIQDVNPTGQRYLEDFSFFMYPFERDINRNVIKSSHFMSDELCHAILDHNTLVESNAPTLNKLINDLIEAQSDLVREESILVDLRYELETILALLDMAQVSGDSELINQRKLERNDKESQIQEQAFFVGFLKNTISALNSQIDLKQGEISNEANFTPELLDELNLFIIESTWRDDNYIDSLELYEDGLKKFEEIRKPKVVIEATIDNLLSVIEEQYYWDKLVLGDLIKIRYPQMNIEYMAKIIEMTYDLDANEVDLTIANTVDLLSENDKLVQLLYSNKSATSLVQNNKYKWDKVMKLEDEVISLITQEWDATKNKIIAGVRNSVQIGNRGIIIENPDFPNDIVIMQSGVIALSKDRGETWKTAMSPDGVVAERLIGQIIAGQNLIITNNSGSFSMDDNGFVINASAFRVRSGTKNLVDEWSEASSFVENFTDDGMITAYEKSRLKEEWTKIALHYDSLNDILSGYYDDGGVSIDDVLVLHQRYGALFDYLHSYIQADGYALLSTQNMDKASAVDRVLFRTRFDEYDSQRLKVEKIISLRAKDLALIATRLAQDARRMIEEIEDDSVYKVELTSTNGLIFRNNVINTTIYARVFKGMNDITSSLPNTSFIWKKYDKDGILDEDWGAENMNVGNTIDIDENDVQHRATFSCDIDIIIDTPEGSDE